MDLETIVAPATPDGEGGLAVVRLSGSQAFAVASRVFRGGGFTTGTPEPRRAVYGILHKAKTEQPVEIEDVDVIDMALALALPAPGSYTGEDTVEFFCHGGRMVVRAVVEACLVAGAIRAPAGEFTRRAFLNGKLSLDQAEAVADLIQAESVAAARAAIGQLRGGLDAELAAIEGPLLALLTEIEGSLEFADDDVAGPGPKDIVACVRSATTEIERLLALCPAGRLLRDGVHIVLTGPPNVGKSSLFNLLLDEDRALVDAEAGTTRDVVTARLKRAQGVFVLHDTAGLRAGAGRVERLGIERSWRQVGEADIVLFLGEAGTPRETLEVPAGVVVIPVATKTDLSVADPADADGPEIATSSVTGAGRDELWAAVDVAVDRFGLQKALELGVALNDRHRHKLQECRDELRLLLADVEAGNAGPDVAGTLLASILSGLGEISGRVFTEQLLENVFRRFCVGK